MPTICALPFRRDWVAQARRIVADRDQPLASASLRAIAWQVLMAEKATRQPDPRRRKAAPGKVA